MTWSPIHDPHLQVFENDLCGSAVKHEKPMKEITGEISAIIRQITASVTFLPLLEEPCKIWLVSSQSVDHTLHSETALV